MSSAVLDLAKRSDYAGKFNDGAPGRWDTIYRSNAWHVDLPNGAKVSLPSPISPAFWHIEFDADETSSVLWLRSLKYLANFERNGVHAWNEIESTIRSFIMWMDGYGHRRDELRSGSLDHQIALRLRTACTLYSLLATEAPDKRTQGRVETALAELVNFDVALASDLDLFVENNHGIMLAISILHASVLFPDVVNGDAAGVWLERLQSSLSRIVDKDGVAPENTVSYQIFYVNLLEQIVEFIEWADWDRANVAELLELADAAVVATRRLVLPDGAVPPIGDSPGGRQSRFRHLAGRLYSPTNGFFVQSDGQTYISLKSGFRSVIHKQMDDGSLIIWRDGVFAIRDAGLLSYDQKDPDAVAIRGQQGHSSTVLRRFDGVNAMKMIGFSANTSRMDGSLELKHQSNRLIDIDSVTSYDGVQYVRRNVSSSSWDRFVITDTYVGSSEEGVVTRFLLDEKVQRIQNDGLLVTASAGSLRVTFDLSDNAWLDAGAVDVVDGFVAAATYKKLPNKVLSVDWGQASRERTLRVVVTLETCARESLLS